MKLKFRPQVRFGTFRNPNAARVGAFRRRLLDWFTFSGRSFQWRRPSATLYMRVLTEVLLQQTQAKSVSALLPSFIRAYPDWQSLATANLRCLKQLLKPLGLWRRRSRALKNLARCITDRGGVWPKTRAELEQMPAVGQYVASAILLFAYGEPEPLLDVNMARVIERYFGPRAFADIRADPYLQAVARQLVRHEDPENVNWAILDFGALICTARRPKCSTCPFHRTCHHAKEARRAGTVERSSEA
jgi:A/G-specific adenine glycosylase